MDENRPPYSLKAPGGSPAGAALRLPGRADFPPVDDHLDEPEVTRRERIGGRLVEALPADGPHAIQHVELDYVVRGKIAPGYRAASDLKTRFAEESDFASDAAVLRDGIDPETGTRFLEELAFEVVSEQSLGNVTEKAPKMIRRGVRRVFGVFVKQGKICEWSARAAAWVELERSAAIEDEALIEPLEVAALLDAAAADNAVASGLVRRNNPVIVEFAERSRTQGRTEGRAEGKAEGLAEGLRRAVKDVCELLDLEFTPERHAALASLNTIEIEALLVRLKRQRRWD